MWNLILHVISAVLGIWMAKKSVPGVQFAGPFLVLVLAGILLAVLNFFIKPALKTITLPLRIITFNLFSLIINMFLIWLVDIAFPELIIPGIVALFWTALIVWLIETVLFKWLPEPKIPFKKQSRCR